MTTLEILKGARELLSDPARWTQWVEARDSYGNEADPLSTHAACFCSVGAVHHVAQRMSMLAHVWDALCFDGLESIPEFNDAPERTHAEVLARFDEAIARLEVQS